jgi:hypothetical protein
MQSELPWCAAFTVLETAVVKGSITTYRVVLTSVCTKPEYGTLETIITYRAMLTHTTIHILCTAV